MTMTMAPHPKMIALAPALALVLAFFLVLVLALANGPGPPCRRYMSISKNVWRGFSAGEVARVRRTYYAMCAETDYMLGTVLDALRATGQYARTYVLFVSDHGEMNMEHRQVGR